MFADRLNLAGKVALITGGGRGIGLAIGEALADCGAVVAIQDIDLSIAESAAANLRSKGGKAHAFGGDVRDLTLPARLVADVLAQCGDLDFLVNNAAIQTYCSWMDLDVKTMQDELTADLLAPILFCREVVPHFKKKQFGRIINLGSIQQHSGNTKMLTYSLSKAAIEKLTTALARDVAKDKITVNCIAPGWMGGTVRNAAFLTSEEVKAEVGKKNIPMGRVGEPADCAGLAVLLCSEAGEYITGQSIYVTGGLGL